MRIGAIAVAVAAFSSLVAQTPAPADLILHNARVYTLDSRNPAAEAVGIRGDRIVRVGTDAQVLALRSSSTRVIDARQTAIVPGLQDAHGHIVGLGASLENLDLRGTSTYQQIVDMVRQRVAVSQPGTWIVGRGWDQNDWPDADWPTHEALSSVSPDNPVYLTRIDGHAALANRAALTLGNVTPATRDPEGGRILRTASGDPAGVLIDRAQDLVASRIPPPSPAQLEAQILLADREARRLGLTSVHDADARRRYQKSPPSSRAARSSITAITVWSYAL